MSDSIEFTKEEALKLMSLQFSALQALANRDSYLEELRARYDVELKDVEIDIVQGRFVKKDT